MKALIDRDIIVHISEKADTEIGVIPADKKKIGLERLRWTGSKIVDLADLTEIWVKHLSDNYFELHAVEVPGSQKVTMTYADRKHLVLDSDTIRVKTAQEVQDDEKAGKKTLAKNRLARKLIRDVGTLEEQLINAYKLILALIVYARLQPQVLADFFDLLIPHIKDTFPLNKVQSELIDAAKSLKGFMDEYYDEIDQL